MMWRVPPDQAACEDRLDVRTAWSAAGSLFLRSLARVASSRSVRDTAASAFRCSTPKVLRRKERKDQIDRNPIHRIEIERPFKPDEHARNPRQAVQARVWQGHAMPHAGRSKRFAFLQRIDRCSGIKPIDRLGNVAQILKQPLLAGTARHDADGALIQKARKVHVLLLPCLCRRVALSRALSDRSSLCSCLRGDRRHSRHHAFHCERPEAAPLPVPSASPPRPPTGMGSWFPSRR